MNGSCLCGALRYAVERLDGPIVHCHCRTCRKAHAAAFATGAVVRDEHFRWLVEPVALAEFASSPGKRRQFCRVCGTPLLSVLEGSGEKVLQVATLDEDPGQVPRAHLWTDHDVRWLACCGGEMHHEGRPRE